MTLLAPSLQSYFTGHAHARKGLSSNTIAAYRDTWRLLIKYLTASTGVPADKIDLGMIDAEAISTFLDHLEADRGNSASTRNARLTAIRAVLAVTLPDHPEHAGTIARVLAVPTMRCTPRTVQFLTAEETQALLDAPDPSTWTGRRDRALLTLAVQTGLRVSELTTLTTSDVHIGTGAHVTCTGKGRKYRATPLTGATVSVLVPYLTERAARPGPAAFPGPRGQHLSRDALEAATGQTRGHRHRTLSLAGGETRHDAHPATHRSDAAAPGRCRRRRHRPVARAREHLQHRRLPARRHDHQTSRDRPHPRSPRHAGHLHPNG